MSGELNLFALGYAAWLVQELFRALSFSMRSIKERYLMWLHDGYLYRLFLLDWRYILNTCIAFSAERIDVHPVLAAHDNLGQTLTH